MLPAATAQHLGPVLCSSCLELPRAEAGEPFGNWPALVLPGALSCSSKENDWYPGNTRHSFREQNLVASWVSSFPRILFPTVPSPALIPSIIQFSTQERWI